MKCLKRYHESMKTFARGYIYLLIVLSLCGANIWAINIKGINVTIFRIISMLLPIVVMLCCCRREPQKSCCSLNHTYNYNNLNNFLYYYFFIVWFIYGLASFLWVKSYKWWIIAEYSLFIGVACIIICNKLLITTKYIGICLKLMYFVLTLHSLIGWFEIISGKYYFISSNMSAIYSINQYPASALGNTNNFATGMLIGFFISISFIYICRSWVIKTLVLLNALSMSCLIYMASSRANLIALILGITFLIFVKKNKFSKSIKVLLIFILLGSFSLIYPTLYQQIINFILELIGTCDNGDSISVRKNLILNGLIFLKESFLLGVGSGNTNYYMEINSCSDGYHTTYGIINMHNWWMEILVDYGVIIFILYIIMYIKLIVDNVMIYKTVSYNIQERYYALSFASFLIAYSIGCISASSNMTKEYIWLFFALILAFTNLVLHKSMQ